VGGVIGVGIAALGADGVNWGWKGVSQVFAAWVVAPAIAGGFGAIIFLITKYGVMKRKDSLRAGLWMIPLYFAVTSGILTMVIVWKGGELRAVALQVNMLTVTFQRLLSNSTTGVVARSRAASSVSRSAL
jgi:sodium-dependent phosphate transporter